MSEQQQTIRVLVFAPGSRGEVREVENDLAPLQAVIGGGYLEQTRAGLPLPAGLFILCDEDGLMNGLPQNRAGLVGTFMVVRGLDEEFVSLTDADEQAVRALLDGPPIN